MSENAHKWMCENIQKYRSEATKDLPMYVRVKSSHKGRQDGYIIIDHPLCIYKGFSASALGSLEDAKNASVMFLQYLEKNNLIFARNDKISIDTIFGDDLYPGFMKAYFDKKSTHVGYIIENHPLCKYKLFSIRSYRTLQITKQATLKYLEMLNKPIK